MTPRIPVSPNCIKARVSLGPPSNFPPLSLPSEHHLEQHVVARRALNTRRPVPQSGPPQARPRFEAVQENTKAKGIDYEIAVSPAQGKFLNLLLQSIGAKRVLAVESLGGYSAIWMARALLEDGQVIALELEELHAQAIKYHDPGQDHLLTSCRNDEHVANPYTSPTQAIEENVKNAGLSSKVKVIVGPAHASMQAMYFLEAKRLLRKGGIIIVDNIGRSGRVADHSNTNASLEGVRELLRYIKDGPQVEATTIHTVGENGFDGFL
ncbi:O-methyltransferase-domain-containing protein [Mycena latifolia]|nr:O-methyltransferase-domain-containing protein [Mycena latifolia]